MSAADDASSSHHTIGLAGHDFVFTVTPRHLHAADRLRALACPVALEDCIRHEAIASANYEGARVSPRQAKTIWDRFPRQYSRGECMIGGVAIALRHVLCTATPDNPTPITPTHICDLHASIAGGSMDDPADVGRYRQTDNIVVANTMTGEVIYRPPAAAVVPAMVEDLCAWHTAATDIDPVVRAMLMHYLLAWIHPFVDGNGRTARVLFYWSCHYAGVYPVWAISLSEPILNDSRPYNKGYRMAQTSGDITPYLDRHAFYLERAIDTAEHDSAR